MEFSIFESFPNPILDSRPLSESRFSFGSDTDQHFLFTNKKIELEIEYFLIESFYILCHNFAHLAKGTRFSMKFSNPIPESTYYWVPVEILWNSWSRISGRIFTHSNRLLCSQKVNLCRDDFLFVKFPLMTNDLDELICCQQVQHCKTLYNSIQ